MAKVSNGAIPFPQYWRVREADEALWKGLAKALDAPPLLGRLLALRGLRRPEDARVFLEAPLTGLHDPFFMKGMGVAAQHLADQVRTGRPIGIYGDYDVDGITSTALLLRFFSFFGTPIAYHIPNRFKEGYGLHLPGLGKLRDAGCTTVVTVDCGISANDVARRARDMGIDLIITDHHRPPERLPEALSVLNPQQTGCNYPFKGLCGVGIAFKLATAVRRLLYEQGFSGELPNLKQHLDLVALGTVADLAPLLDENHIFVRAGLEILSPPQVENRNLVVPPDRRKPGIRALQSTADLKAEAVNSGHIAFVLAPRLNAAGRMGEATPGVELLTTEDLGEARMRAEVLEEWNRQRQQLQQEALDEALFQLGAAGPGAMEEAIVLSSERWHPGVIGIVASQLVERHYRPTVLIHLNGDEGKGSVRGVPGLHVYETLERCGDLLLQFGGHAGAAGLTIHREKVGVFRERFAEAVSEQLGPEPPERTLWLDGVVDLAELNVSLLEQLELLAPFGSENPRPVLAAGPLMAAGTPSVVGRNGDHLKLFVKDMRGQRVEAIGFGMGNLLRDPSFFQGKFDAAFSPGLNRWRGNARVQLELRAIRPAGGC